MRARVLWGAICVLVMGTMAFGDETIIDIPMDQQINVGQPPTEHSPNGDAIYVPPGYNGSISFETDGEDGWCRNTIQWGDAWYYGPYIDFYLAGYGEFDISGTTGFQSTLNFDCRYYQDWDTNGNPYNDAPVFVRFYVYDIPNDAYQGYRDYGIVYQTGINWECFPIDIYPAWYHVSMRLDDPDFDGNCDGTPDITEGGDFDVTRVSRMRFYGTDWAGGSEGPINDWVDIKNVVLVVELPAPCPGDIDGDGDTDHADLGELLAAWCTQEGDPNWNPNADLDGDGHVGHGDLGILLADWGCGT